MTPTGFAESPPLPPPKSIQLLPKWFSKSYFSPKCFLKCPFLILNMTNLAPNQFLHGVKIC